MTLQELHDSRILDNVTCYHPPEPWRWRILRWTLRAVYLLLLTALTACAIGIFAIWIVSLAR